MMNRLLIVEDDNEINDMIRDYFEMKGFKVHQAFSGTEALLLANQKDYDVMLLDLMLPGKKGEEVLRQLKSCIDIPILIISAKDKDQSTIETLKLGADDFIAKPFNIEELGLRVARSLRMYQRIHEPELEEDWLYFEKIALSERKRIVKIADTPLNLTVKEFDILALLMKHPSQVFTKEKILEIVWHDEVEVDTNAVAVHVSNLRKKLGKNAVIKTIWGIGFKLESPL